MSKEALERFVSNHKDYESLLKYATSLTRHRQDAEDIVQDAFLGAWSLAEKNMLEISGMNRVCAYLKKVCRNLYADYKYQKKRQGKKIVIDDPELLPLENGLAANGLIALPEQECAVFAKELAKMIPSSVPLVYYETFLLSREGSTYKDIMEKFKIPLGTVQSRLSRARSKINDLAMGYA